ncbi:MAG: molecular chaperone, partial [Halobacteriales archaeon]|nr:molecular chaperone [Halobacteriales archaeon]
MSMPSGPTTDSDAVETKDPSPSALTLEDTDAGARGGVYALLARGFAAPDEDLHRAFVEGTYAAEVTSLLDRSPLSVEVPSFETADDPDLLAA